MSLILAKDAAHGSREITKTASTLTVQEILDNANHNIKREVSKGRFRTAIRIELKWAPAAVSSAMVRLSEAGYNARVDGKYIEIGW